MITRHPLRHLGAAIGAAAGVSAAFAQSYSGNADGRVHVWLMAIALGAGLGGLTLPLFVERPDQSPSPGFLALFGFAVCCVAGTFVTFPVGASLGTFGAAIGGLVAGLVWRIRRLRPSPWRAPVTAVVAMVMAGLSMYGWTNN